MLDRGYVCSPHDGVAARKAAKRVVVCGSMAFYGYMLRVKEHLERSGVPVALPDPEDDHIGALGQAEYERFKRRVSLAHLRRVRHRDTFAILVLNLDKHGTPDYIGPSTYAEIAMASAFNKPVYLVGDFPAAYAEELAAWGAVRMNGRLDRLVEDHWASCVPRQQSQMKLFGVT